MSFIYQQKLSKQFLYKLFFILISIIFISYFINSYFIILGDEWAYNELFINYSAGIIKRGLLGSIFLKLNEYFGIEPLNFFSSIFIILYSLQIFIYYKLLKKFQNYSLIIIFVIFSPIIILFSIYDQNTYFAKDIFTNLTILIHAYYIVNRKKVFSIESYNKFLLFKLIPLLSINILNHENQFFFIGIHLLFTTYTYISNNISKKNKKYYYYLLTLIPLIIIVLNTGNFEKVEIINSSIEKFGVKVNNQLAGNINLAIGGFIKWHFFFHDIESFKNLFLCLILSLYLFYVVFDYLIKKEILLTNKFIKKNYIIYFFPTFAIFILAIDHGRTINLILAHLFCFYLILDVNKKKLNLFYNQIINKTLLKNLVLLFLFFYIFLWYIPQGAGYSGIGQFGNDSSIFKNTLFGELTRIFMIFYDLISYYIIELPRVKI